jgi:hypothetical protein
LDKKKKNKALHWPIGIFLAIVAVVCMGIWTLNIANKNPVVLDEYYFDTYQDVDHNSYEIKKSQEEFNKRYKISYNLEKFNIGNNALKITVTTKDNKPIENAKIRAKITRPFTNKQDIDLKLITSENGNYLFNDFNIDKVGRWQILSKVTVGKYTSFTKIDINATK